MMDRGIEKPVWRIPLPWGPGSTSDNTTPPLGVQVNFILQNSLDNLHDSKAIISLLSYLTRSWSKGGQFTEECEARNLQPPRCRLTEVYLLVHLVKTWLLTANSKCVWRNFKEFYEYEALKQKNEDRIKQLKKFSKVINPLFCVGFVIVFWAAGMQHYYQEL